jgi:maltose/moltooligosaccharide transporter
MQKPRLSFWQIWNMSFGFLGIQFGWGLQLGNMSAIYEKLGAKPDQIPWLWLAAPLTGLIVQPIIGAMSDRTWGWMGRRRPYFLTGAILATAALFILPSSSTLWMAAGLLWILDASINISMEPFRAFVADKLNDEQRNVGFVMQSFFIGLGAVFAGVLPLIFRKLSVTAETASGIPLTVKYSFEIGAVVFLLAVVWTVVSSSEYPPEDMDYFRRRRMERAGPLAGVREIISAIREMPLTMRQLAVVQMFTWLGLFCMWLFFVPTIARKVYGATDPKSLAYSEGAEWGNFFLAIYSVVCFLVAFTLPRFAKVTSRKTVHSIALGCGGLGLLSIYVISTPGLVPLTMVGVGIAWASILSMPYAILSGALPRERIGVYMGIFNFFIVIPEIIQSLTMGWLIKNLFNDNPLFVVMLGGAFLLIAALFLIPVVDVAASQEAPERGALTRPVLAESTVAPVLTGRQAETDGRK